ncbi:MAG: HEAT repeat domain-containing protein [Vampirovibrio sp.]|nr:HEAT repeat domain-containing protein [Vampirovibrio sp.]
MMTIFSSFDSFSQLYRRVMLRYLPAVCGGRRAVITNIGVLYSLESDFFDDETEDQPASESMASSVEGFSPYEYFDTEPTIYAEKTSGLAFNQSNQLKNLLNSVLNETVPISKRQNALKQAFSLLKQKDFTQQPFWLVPTIIELLKQSTCVPLLLEALQGLGNIKVQGTIPTLVAMAVGTGVRLFDAAEGGAEGYAELLKQESIVKLRCQAIRLLGIMGAEEATVPLMTLLHDKSTNYRVRLEVAEALGRLQNSRAVNPLIQLLKDEKESSVYVKESAVKALGMLGDIRALEPLLDLFEAQQGFRKKTTFLFEQVVTAIGKLGQQNHPASRKKALDSLLKALQDDAPSIRLAAVEALSEVGEVSDLPCLTPLLFDENMDVAHATLVSIYKLGDIEALQRILREEENLPHYLCVEIQEFLLLEDEADDDEDEVG